MIFIVVKFTTLPDRSDDWLALVKDFTEATRQEPGNLFFEWSRSVDSPDEFVLIEAFQSGAAGEHHVTTEHFKAAMAWMPEVIAQTPQIINVELPGDGWATMSELKPVRVQ